ncbi:MAG TPA: hypothetical protein VGP92_17905 [Acidimicrobiia bacterium]|nr:hypothetical protein [Acidimicrobiia bacterium]
MAADYVTLQRLVDARDVDGLLGTVSTDDVAEAWCQYSSRHGRAEPARAGNARMKPEDAHWWAIEFVRSSGVTRREGVLRELLVKLVEHAPNDEVLGNIGAGPIEDFIVADEARVRWIEEQAESSPAFRQALSIIWIWGHQPQWVCERIERAAGVPLRHPADDSPFGFAQAAADTARQMFSRVRGALRLR